MMLDSHAAGFGICFFLMIDTFIFPFKVFLDQNYREKHDDVNLKALAF